MNAPNMICFENKFDNGWADLKIKFDRKATFHYIEFKHSPILNLTMS